jgi:hypothetical protein
VLSLSLHILNIPHPHLLNSLVLSLLQVFKLVLCVQRNAANVASKFSKVFNLLDVSFVLEVVDKKVLCLSLRIPKLFFVLRPVYFHLFKVLLAFIFKLVVNLAGNTRAQSAAR